jgi:hypothetical protein
MGLKRKNEKRKGKKGKAGHDVRVDRLGCGDGRRG